MSWPRLASVELAVMEKGGSFKIDCNKTEQKCFINERVS